MNIGREHFDPDTLGAMDEVATLILMSQRIFEAEETFKNAPGLDSAEAKPFVNRILRFGRETSADLVAVAFAKKSECAGKVLEVYRTGMEDLDLAIDSAKWLAEQEEQAMTSSQAKGGIMRKQVLVPLSTLKERWECVLAV